MPSKLSDSKTRLIRRLCEESVDYQHRLGAILLKGGAVISIGINHTGSSKILRKYQHLRPQTLGIHAEVSAILGITKAEASKCVLIVGRVNSKGIFGLAKPCPMCQEILREMGVRKVYYTTGEYEEGVPLIEQLD